MKVEGVKEVTFDLSKEQGFVIFDPSKTDLDTILYKIEEKGYECFILDSSAHSPQKDTFISPRTVGWVFGLIGIVIALYFIITLTEGIQLPEISQNMGYGLLFIVGLLTGFHCIAMCGGFVVSYTAKDAQENRSSHRSHIMYGIGKTLSYTLIGAFFGLLGSIIAFTPMMRGVAGLLAGLFLVLFGLKMLNIIPALRKIQFHTPRFLSRWVGKESAKNSSPLVIGLLNGLMIACGPLQAIYIMAAGTGSPLEGAKLLFIFGLGTLPVMLGFAYFTSFISGRMTGKILKASGVIVIVLGMIMLNRGLALTGSGLDIKSLTGQISDVGALKTGSASQNVPLLNDAGYQEIHMTVDRYGYTPDRFVLKRGVPVKWIIDGKEITGCNNAIQVPKLGLQFPIKKGEQVIEFTPTESGTISWSCWMGMIPGTFIVKDNVDLDDAAQVQKELDNAPTPAAGGCGMNGGAGCGSPSCGGGSGGGCGCGG
ncbi:TPA: sulfite exporter TauE/SafE family protein [Candidatus Woesearchaeota archaeon]|nr:sulfite exporter TauE/SafE family protein [Candidatus Woesearchaeota archaeon]